jgi:hypothetical protein
MHGETLAIVTSDDGVSARADADGVEHAPVLGAAAGCASQRSASDYLEQISKVQTRMIDGLMAGWKEQLKSPTPMKIPHRFTTGPSSGGVPQFNPLTPWIFWMQAAEMWQRTWMPDMSHKDRSR